MPESRRSRPVAPALVVVALLAAAPLCWKLGDRYLWQDEAQTAVLAERWLELGLPLAYDGRNLLTLDVHEVLTPEAARRIHSDAVAAVQHYARRGDFRADTTWTAHPWGQFAAAALSMRLLGKGTWQARLPFALMGIATVVLLFALARRRFADPLVAPLAVALLLGNVYWILHARQCRYYAASTLLLLVTLAAWLRWQDGKRFGAAGFVAAAWCWFQFDYGSVWPGVGVLLAEALRRAWPHPRAPLLAGLAFALCVAPFAWFYRITDRLQPPAVAWWERFFGTASLVDHYVLAIPLVAAILAWLAARGRTRPEEARLLALSVALLAAFLVWVPISTQYPFHRYVVALTPIGCLLAGWLIAELARLAPTRAAQLAVALALASLVILTPLASLPFSWLVPGRYSQTGSHEGWRRIELGLYAAELADLLPDPNRILITALAERLAPGDEVLTNLEDYPVMFYTDARVRGGIPGFRIEAADGVAPRFAILWPSSTVSPIGPFVAATRRHRWREVPVEAPDIPGSNIPDPAFRPLLRETPAGSIVFLERELAP